jgi:type VI secretion system protein ImpL
MRWEPASPISLTLRLAKDSPVYASMDPQQPHMVTDGKTITYKFADSWALLRLIQRHRDFDTSGRSDGKAQLLRFEFPIFTTGEIVKAGAQESRAKVFIRLTISPVGKRAPLVWPATFPSRAPDMSNP